MIEQLPIPDCAVLRTRDCGNYKTFRNYSTVVQCKTRHRQKYIEVVRFLSKLGKFNVRVEQRVLNFELQKQGCLEIKPQHQLY